MKICLLIICVSLFTSLYSQNDVKPDGYNIFYYGNGNISSEGLMKDGKPDGFWKTYYINGKIKSAGIRKNFLLDSIWLFYYENGNIKESISYLYGKKNGYYTKYQNINNINQPVISDELFLNDLKNGKSFYYHPDGKIEQIINYKEGKKHGLSKIFTTDSIVEILMEYHNDFLIDREIINQTDNSGLKQGIWKEFFENDNLKIEANYLDDKLHGLYKEYNARGRLINSLRYENGLITESNVDETNIEIEIRNEYNTDGKVISSGGFKENIPVGMHREYTEDEEIIKTKIYNDFGKVIAKGNVNSRGYKIDAWEEYYNNGAIKAKGSYANNQKEGKWLYYYPAGELEQSGNYKGGKEDGYWEWFHLNGNILRQEHFYNGLEDGEMIEYSETGDLLTRGEYIEGLKEGKWIYRVGDHSESGAYKYGKRDGRWIYLYEDGTKKFEGNFIQGNPDGKHKYFHENGKLQEERIYIMGRKEKTWKKFDPAGNLLMVINYQNDEEVKIDGVKIEK